MKLIKKKNITFLLSGGGSNLYQILKKNLTFKKFNVISIISNNLISKQVKELIKSNNSYSLPKKYNWNFISNQYLEVFKNLTNYQNK